MDIDKSKNLDLLKEKFDTLVLGPGGIKGYLELGAVFQLEKKGILQHINKYVGVSVGAIISLLINIGIPARDILYIAIDNVNIIDVESDDFNIIEIIKNIKNNLGIFSLNHMKNILTKIVVKKYGYIPTLKQLHLLTEKELYIVVFNLSESKTEYMSHINYPDIDCIDAVLLSINIPLVFWRMTLNNHVYIDGAFGDPYPVLLHDNGINNILGIYIKTSTDDKSYKNFLLYLHDIIHCLFHTITSRNIEESSDKCLHIGLENKVLDTMGTTLSIDDKANMFISGLKIIDELFKNYNNKV